MACHEGQGHHKNQCENPPITKIHFKYKDNKPPTEEVKYRIRRRKTKAFYRSGNHFCELSDKHEDSMASFEWEMLNDRFCRSKSDRFICGDKERHKDGKVQIIEMISRL